MIIVAKTTLQKFKIDLKDYGLFPDSGDVS
jgi:hypothetical protein